MRIRYLDWKEGTRALADRLRLLQRLFAVLLVQEDGDAERALQILGMAGRRYDLFDDALTFEDLKRHLLQERLVSSGPAGVSLTPRGERFIRTESLNGIFSVFAANLGAILYLMTGANLVFIVGLLSYAALGMVQRAAPAALAVSGADR